MILKDKSSMENITLQADPRRAGRHRVRELRQADHVPAVVYGRSIEPQTIALEARALQRALRAAGSGLLTLQIAGQPPVQVLSREIQRDPVKHHMMHVDFQVVSMTQKLRLHVPLEQQGTAPVMSNPDVVLVRQLDAIEIECLPGDIPSHLVADISRLQTIDDELLVGDLVLPPGVRLLTDRKHVVFSVTLSRAGLEEEEEEEEEVVAAEEVEVVAKGKAARGEEEEE
jgi:large subunit ribosomal protein L25